MENNEFQIFMTPYFVKLFIILFFRNHEKSNVGMFGEVEIFGLKSAWESHYALATKMALSVDKKIRI